MKLLLGSFVLVIFLTVSWWYFQSTQSVVTSTRPVATSSTQNDTGSLFSSLLQPEPSPTPDPTLTIMFAGDVMLDRTIRQKAQQIGYTALIGPELKKKMRAVDYAVVNLEGPVTTQQSLSVGSQVGSPRNYYFTFAPEALTTLTDANISIVNLGNNHILNFGSDGLAQTYQFLDQAGIHYFGLTGETQPENSRTYILKHSTATIGFVNCNQFFADGEKAVFDDIQTIKPIVDYLIVYTHWGNEYVPENQVLINLAHRLVDQGADLVIGSHPHVITGNELYQGKHIYYSLGNFIFDQYFDENVKKGLVVTATINPLTKETTIEKDAVTLQRTGITELESVR